ncbi:hypothetical protein LPW11_00850 [Geomonas sp. RF6]|uniref:hypothetical protein n=1 Tax=Geomonas sp. RF6 TaxID=2897342 RepID=UPI001E3FFC52|nr:hypothetical protein [Geomonas sp. RF6]UFS70752.1 hypothetical protein LPW11_00850 [Geomonas sp. RF6]
MANTEIIKVLQVVREAKEAVNGALSSSPGDEQLEKLSTTLEEVESALIFSEIEEKVAQLQQYRKALEEINCGMKTEIEKLKAVSEKVNRAAKALGILADIVGRAATLGVV